MKILRLILFIPAFFATIIVGNILLELLYYLFRFLNYYSMEHYPDAILWQEFLRNMLVTFGGILVGTQVYPFQNKLLPIILFNIFYVMLFVFLYFFYTNFWDIIIKSTTPMSMLRQIFAAVGILVGVGYFWYSYIKDELDL